MRPFRLEGKPARLSHFYPATVLVVGVSSAGRINFMPVVWHSALSFEPPLFGVWISPKRFTHEMLQSAPSFSVSMHPQEQWRQIHAIGTTSGRRVCKVKELGLSFRRGGELDVPILQGAYAAYELEKQSQIKTGDHDLFVGRLRALWEDESAFAGEALDPKTVSPLLYFGKYLYGRPCAQTMRPSEV